MANGRPVKRFTFNRMEKLQIKIRYFVPFDDLMGKSEFVVVEEGTVGKEIFSVLSKRHPDFATVDMARYLLLIVNARTCPEDYRFRDGDVVSILYPVEGG